MAVTRLRTYIENLVTAIGYIFDSFGIFCQKSPHFVTAIGNIF